MSWLPPLPGEPYVDLHNMASAERMFAEFCGEIPFARPFLSVCHDIVINRIKQKAYAHED